LKSVRRAYRKKIATGVKEDTNQKGVKATGGKSSLLEPQNLAIKPTDAISLHLTPLKQDHQPLPSFQQSHSQLQPQYQNPILSQAESLTLRDNLVSKGLNGKYQDLNGQMTSQKQQLPPNICFVPPNNFECTPNIYFISYLRNNINFINLFYRPSQFYDVQNKVTQVEAYPMQWQNSLHVMKNSQKYDVNQPFVQMPANYCLIENQILQIPYTPMIQATPPVNPMFHPY